MGSFLCWRAHRGTWQKEDVSDDFSQIWSCDKLIWLNLILVHEIVTRNSVPNHSPCLLGNVIWRSWVIGRRACWVLVCSSLTGWVSVLSAPILLHGLQWGGSRSVVGIVNNSIVQWLQRGDQAFMWTSLSYIPSTHLPIPAQPSAYLGEPQNQVWAPNPYWQAYGWTL